MSALMLMVTFTTSTLPTVTAFGIIRAMSYSGRRLLTRDGNFSAVSVFSAW